jgi:imidazole glycerol-phosphate synthase subunit HisF
MSILPVRIIPRLDIKGYNLVKGIKLEGLRVLGDPEIFAEYYYSSGADELFYQDVVASLYEQNGLYEIIKKTAKKIFIPLTVGGGIRTIDDIKNVLRVGADKVSINTAAVKDPDFVNQAVKKFGSSTIVVSIEAIKNKLGNYIVSIDSGRELTNLNVIDWAIKVSKLGAGEIFLTSVDNEGTGIGFDNNLIINVKKAVDIPVIAHGGCLNYQNVVNTCKETLVDAISCASMFHYPSLKKLKDKFNQEMHIGNRDFLNSSLTFKKFANTNIQGLKDCMHKNGISVRPFNG